MSILAIDFGLKHVGLALSTNGVLAEPLGQIKYQDKESLLKKLEALVGEHNVQKIIIGISEGKMGEETEKFGQTLFLKIKIPVFYQDETLSSIEAWHKMVEGGIPQKKRRTKEHQVAAAKILQDFLDEKKSCC